ncbi:cobalt ECF transporter T component CbiQ [Methanocella conradii]|uniref:cobalt ECF transporter T component CbiQ n=1 Tax=Methanocella conradii TaxID=1175444 RepID=UPI00157D193D|nr:cobalt ECF transporter T component CbiQ [Methanocella conradii]
MIPEWMKEGGEGLHCPGAVVPEKKNFVQKTLIGIFSFLEEAVTSEAISRKNGLLQSLDPRVKLISIIALIVAVSVTHELWALIAVYLLTLLFAYLSRTGLWLFIKRVWLFIPIFTGIIVFPMVFNVFFPGDSLVTLATLGEGAKLGPFSLPETVSITRQGLISAMIFTLRVATCVSATVLLFLTTPRDMLFKSLRTVGVPKVYVLTLDMCYRYIFLFMDMVKSFYMSKKSRSIRSLPLLEEQKWVGGRIGYTLIKSLDMGEKVHGAMVSRGFNGDVKIMEDFKMKPRDYTALASTLTFSLLLILIAQKLITL